ncbi:MAG: ATP-binding cassette domain-containing protein [Alphaproteobacteria bacterium]
MAPPPVLSLRQAWLTFGGEPLFRGVDLAASRGDRICLIGRNGSGKSTLLKVLAGMVTLDGGEWFLQPGTRVAYLSQDPVPDGDTVAHYVAGGLPEGAKDDTYRVGAVLDAVGLDGSLATASLSGGEGRRAALARALVGDPDVLLLDEPTNHLDVPTIRWLEAELLAFRGALVVISHDRTFLNTVSRRTWWLERGVVRTAEHGYARFEDWREAVADEEEKALSRLDTKLAAEMHWLHRGVTARRSRNMGRLRRLHALRAERVERMRRPGDLDLVAEAGTQGGKAVIEAKGVSFAYGDRVLVRDFSTRILRGDRVGLIGPNGAGKTTLLRLLIGDLAPDVGTVRLGTGLVPAYFDQRREALDPDLSVWKTLAGSSDQIDVRGQPRHVMGYLKDFQFDQRQAMSPVRALSGGERNRLLLARLLARTSNLIIMDEPTNDLDMDTLDLLEEALGDYDGTLLLVSHDRDFLDRLVTSVIAVEGDGRIDEYVGGYSDYLIQRPAVAPPTTPTPAIQAKAVRDVQPKAVARKLSYRDQRELDELPARIEALHAEMATIEATLADAGLYARAPKDFARATARLPAVQADLAAMEERWLELEMRREALEGGR